MLRISDEDYRTLELRIQKEVKKVLLQFLDDLEHRTIGPGEPAIPYERESLLQSEPDMSPRSAVRKRPRGRSKKSVETMMRLQGLPPATPQAPRSLLDEDMEKILKLNKPRKKRAPGAGR